MVEIEKPMEEKLDLISLICGKSEVINRQIYPQTSVSLDLVSFEQDLMGSKDTLHELCRWKMSLENITHFFLSFSVVVSAVELFHKKLQEVNEAINSR